MIKMTAVASSICIAALALLAFACGDTSGGGGGYDGQASTCEIPPGTRPE